MDKLFIDGGYPAIRELGAGAQRINYQLTNEDLEEYYKYAPNFCNYRDRYFVNEFEKKFSRYIYNNNDGIGIATSSCNSSLKIALKAIGITNEDEVIVPAFTFISDASVVLEVGAKVIYADLEDNRCTIDVEDIKKKISPKTKAIILVHLYGIPCNVEEIMEFAHEKKLWIIEDCAQALGTKINSQNIGSFGDVACFSFNQTKIISSEEGGMLLTRNKEIARKTKYLINNGFNDKGRIELVEGSSYRMTNLQAFILQKQLNHIDELVAKNKKVSRKYHEMLMNSGFLQFYNENYCYCYYPILLNYKYSHEQVSWIRKMLFAENIPFMNTIDVPLPKITEKYNTYKYVNAERHCSNILKLYTYSHYEDEFISDIVKGIYKVLHYADRLT